MTVQNSPPHTPTQSRAVIEREKRRSKHSLSFKKLWQKPKEKKADGSIIPRKNLSKNKPPL